MAKKDVFSSREREEEKEAKEIKEKVFSYINNMGHNKEFLAKIFTDQHPTIQQSLFGVIVIAIKKWAEDCDKGWYDLRNEATCKACKKIVETFGKEFYLPFV